LVGSQLSLVHGLVSSQLTALPGWQAPLLQVSPTVQTLPSLQGAVLLADLQPPWASQVSVVQGLLSLQALGPLGVQTPALQASPMVQALLSEQAAVLLLCWQPFDLSQESSVQGLPSSQLMALPGTQEPAAQVSPWEQTLASSQGALLLLCWQPFAKSQESLVQGLLSSQLIGAPGVQTVAAQMSPLVHTLPSEQAATLAACLQPLALSQESSVHGLPSSQFRPAPGMHALALQLSPTVQTEPSEHGEEFAVETQP